MQRLRGVADAHGAAIDEGALGVQSQRKFLQRRDVQETPGCGGEDRGEHRQPLRAAQVAHRVVARGHAPHQRGAGAALLVGGKRQQGRGAVAREALEGQARRGAFQNHLADPRGLAVVAGHRLANLIGEHTAFGHHGQVKTLGNTGVHLHATLHRFQRCHRRAEACAQARRLRRHLGLPGPLQRRHQSAVGQHRAELRHAKICRAQTHLGRAE